VDGCAKVYRTIEYRAFVPALAADGASMMANVKV
jgi:hypothetical protein